MVILRALCLVAVVLASGCATSLRVTYTSEPIGAALYEGDRHMGTTPMTLAYPVSEEDKKIGRKRLRGTSVRWISGATASVSYLNADFRNGYGQVFHFRRPDGVPGYDVDANYALQLQRNAIMLYQATTQAEAARQAEATRRRQLQLQQQQMLMQQAPRPTNCTSQVIGNTVYTNCN